MGETEKELQKLWIVARLRTREGWYETSKFDDILDCQVPAKELPLRWRAQKTLSAPYKTNNDVAGIADPTGPYARFDPDKIHNSLTAGSLRGPGKLAVPPIVFAKDDESEAIGKCENIRIFRHKLTISSCSASRKSSMWT